MSLSQWLTLWYIHHKKTKLRRGLAFRKLVNPLVAWLIETVISPKKMKEGSEFWNLFLVNSESFVKFRDEFDKLVSSPYNCTWQKDPPNVDYSPSSPSIFFAKQGDDCDGWSALAEDTVRECLHTYGPDWGLIEHRGTAYRLKEFGQVAVYGLTGTTVTFGHMIFIMRFRAKDDPTKFTSFVVSNHWLGDFATQDIFDFETAELKENVKSVLQIPADSFNIVYSHETL